MLNSTSLYEKAMEAAEDYADKEHAAGVLEDALDALKGSLVAKYKAKGEAVTIINNLVKDDPEYKLMATQWRDAVKAYRIARLKYDQICRYQDNEKTNEVTARQLTT